MSGIPALENYWDNYFGLPAGFNEGLGQAESGNQNLPGGSGSSVGVFQQQTGWQQQYGQAGLDTIGTGTTYDPMNPSDQIAAADQEITQYPNYTAGLNAYHFGANSSQVSGPLYSAYSGIPLTGGDAYSSSTAQNSDIPTAAQNAAGEAGLPYTPLQPGGPLQGAVSTVADWWDAMFADVENFAERFAVIALAGAIAIVALISLVKHQSPGVTISQGAKTAAKAAALSG